MTVVDKWLADNDLGSIVKKTPLSGGFINDTSLIETDQNERFCLKQNSQAPTDFFASEAEGLNQLSACQSVRTPNVLHVDENFLLLEYIQPGETSSDYWLTLAQNLTKCHQQVQTCFGFSLDNYCGETPQINPQMENGFDFFAQHRLLNQTQWARDKNLLTRRHCQKIELLANNLDSLIPSQSPALLHGDLWSGNIHTDEDGQPVLIDPACYWGWPEADLAMTQLFGGFEQSFYQHYQEAFELESGWRERVPLYNLYHLLNHLNLFGGSYLSTIEKILHRFS